MHAPKEPAECLLYQIYSDEVFLAREGIKNVNDNSEAFNEPFTKYTPISGLAFINIIDDIMMNLIEEFKKDRKKTEFKEPSKITSHSFRIVDKVEAIFFLKENYSPDNS